MYNKTIRLQPYNDTTAYKNTYKNTGNCFFFAKKMGLR